jgi:hypothetical protein
MSTGAYFWHEFRRTFLSETVDMGVLLACSNRVVDTCQQSEI